MKNKKLLVLVPFLLLMASCGDKNSNSNSISDSNSTSNSTNQSTTGEWKDELKTMMTSMLGETLPYFELGNYQFSVEEDDDGEYIYIYAESETDFVVEYTSVLTKSGYTDDGIEEDDYVAYFFVKGDIVVQIDYYPGDTTYKARNEIFAWVEDNGGGSDIPDTPTEKTDLTAWPTELKELMTSTFNMEIPFVALAKDFEYELTDGQLTIYDSANVNFLEDYGDSLLAANFELGENEWGEAYTHDYDEDYYIEVSFYYSDSLDLGELIIPGGNEIDVSLVQIIKEVDTDTWPEEEVKSIYNSLSKVNVPSFDVVGKYTYYFYGDSIVVYGAVNSDITDEYVTKLTNNNFLTYESSYSQFYYDWEEYVQVQIQYISDTSSFMIQVFPMEASYDEFVTSFPEDKIKSFLGESATSVPSIDIKYGENIKHAHVNEDLEDETPEYIQLTYKDEGTVGSNSIMDEYLVTLRAQEWIIDDSNYNEYGYYVATSKTGDVVLTFESLFGIFILDIEKGA